MKKACFTLLLTAAMLLIIVTPAYAISYTDVQITSGSGFGGGSRDNPSDTVLSYAELSTLCDEVNAALQRGYYSGLSGCSAQLIQIVGSDYHYYIIQVTGDGSTYTVRNSEDMLVRTKVMEGTNGDYFEYLSEIIDDLVDIQAAIYSVRSAVNSVGNYLSNIETALGTGVGTLGYNVQRTLNYLSGPIYTALSSIDLALTDADDSPLLTRLDSIKNALQAQNNTSNNYYSDLNSLLAALRSSLENLTINADSLENLTINAYDDSTLMSYVDTISMNTDLINAWVASVNSNVSSISKDLGFVRRSATTIATHITNIDSAFTSELLPAVTDCSTKLSQLAASGGETPTTLHDYISMRIVPLQVSLGNNVSLMVNTTSSISTKLSTISDTVTSISGVAAENNTILSRMDTNLATLTSSVDSIAYAVGNGGLQGRNLMNLLDSVNTRVEAVRKAVVTLSPYDDTNMIAAVNSVETALSNLSFSGEVNTDLTPVITSIDAVGVNIEDLNANFNTSLGSLVDKLDVIVDKSSESMENLTVEISVDNDAHNVFYITDEDGNEESLVDFSGDVLKAGGKLLNFLFKVCFDGAIDNLDGSIDDMDSFYFDGAELGGSLWE